MGTSVRTTWRGRVLGAVVVAVLAVTGSAAPQTTIQKAEPIYSYTVRTGGIDPSSLRTRHRVHLRPDSRETNSREVNSFPPHLLQGASGGNVQLHPASTESLEVQGYQGGQGHHNNLENGAYSVAVALGNSFPRAGPRGSSGSGGTSRSSQFLVFGDDDDDDDSRGLQDSLENDDDDDNFRFMSLGRRYHPDGVAPTAQKDLFIPPTAKMLARPGPAATPNFNNPFFLKLDDSTEDDQSTEDFSDVGFGYPIAGSAVGIVPGDTSSEERIELDEGMLSDRYNFVDGQGSIVWGYELEDQHQHQEVRQDGSMKGRYGWTAPDGHQVNIEYIADQGGYRVLSSHGIHPKNTDAVVHLTNKHKQAHQEAVSRRPVVDHNHGLMMSSGVPLHTLGQPVTPTHIPGQGSNNFGSGVPLPTLSGTNTNLGFIDDDDERMLVLGGGHGGSVSGQGFGGGVGVPLPPVGAGNQNFNVGAGSSGGVPLPFPAGPGAPGGAMPGPGFFGDDGMDSPTLGMDRNAGAGVPLPGSFGPDAPVGADFGPGTPGPIGGGFEDPTMFGGGGVPLPPPGVGAGGPGFSPSSPGAGGVPLPDSIDFGAPGSFETRFGSTRFPGENAGVPLPSPVGPGTPGFMNNEPQGGTGVGLPSGAGSPGFMPDHCKLASKTHPSLLPPECSQFNPDAHGGVSLSDVLAGLDSEGSNRMGAQGPTSRPTGFLGSSGGVPLLSSGDGFNTPVAMPPKGGPGFDISTVVGGTGFDISGGGGPGFDVSSGSGPGSDVSSGGGPGFDISSGGGPGFDISSGGGPGFDISSGGGPGFDISSGGGPGFDISSGGGPDFDISSGGGSGQGFDFNAGGGGGVTLPSFDQSSGSAGFGGSDFETPTDAPSFTRTSGQGVPLPTFGPSSSSGGGPPTFSDQGFGGGPGFDISSGGGPGFDVSSGGGPGFDISSGGGPGFDVSSGGGVGGVILPSFDQSSGSAGFGGSDFEIPTDAPSFTQTSGQGVPLPSFGPSSSSGGGPSTFSDQGFGSTGAGVGLPDFGGVGTGGSGRFSVTKTIDSSSGVGLPGFPTGPDGSTGFEIDLRGLGLPGGAGPSFDSGSSFGVGIDQGFSDSVGTGGGVGLPSFGSDSDPNFSISSGGQGFGQGDGVGLPGFGSGVEVPLQGPPHLSSGSGISLSNEVGGGSQINNNNGGPPFFESGPPESVPQTTGGPPTHTPDSPPSPLPALTDLSTPLASAPAQDTSNHLGHQEAEVLSSGASLPGDTAPGRLMEKTQSPQDVAQVYHDIYGIKMKLDNWEARNPSGLSVPSL